MPFMPLVFQSLQIVTILMTITFRNQPELIPHGSPGVHDWPRITCRFPLSTPPVSRHFSSTASARFFHTLPVRRSDVPVHSDVPDLPRCTAHNQKPANIRSVFCSDSFIYCFQFLRHRHRLWRKVLIISFLPYLFPEIDR